MHPDIQVALHCLHLPPLFQHALAQKRTLPFAIQALFFVQQIGEFINLTFNSIQAASASVISDKSRSFRLAASSFSCMRDNSDSAFRSLS